MNQLQEQIDRNYEAFEAILPKLLETELGRWVLLRNQAVEAIFDTAQDAQTAGEKIFPDGLFSSQRVTNRAVDLGWFSHAVPQRNV